MDVTSATGATSATSTTANSTGNSPVASTDYTTFLKMMTTQIQNQDPLNPVSADQFAVQLATFAQVQQQTMTNDLLTQQLAQNKLDSLSQMVGWVGKEARIAAPAHFDGTTAITLSPNPAVSADRAVLVVKNAAGAEVSRTQIPLGSADYQWQGRDNTGAALPAGNYDLALESYQGDTLLGATAIEHYGRITEIRSSVSGVTALFDGGIEASTGLITALRA